MIQKTAEARGYGQTSRNLFTKGLYAGHRWRLVRECILRNLSKIAFAGRRWWDQSGKCLFGNHEFVFSLRTDLCRHSQMDQAEEVVHRYLGSIGSAIVYEPDGNVPPDFLVDDNLAVEVRTLNENHFGPDKVQGLERDRARCERALKKVLHGFTTSTPTTSYWVAVDFSRPLGDLNRFKARARKELKQFRRSARKCPCEIRVPPSVKITLHRADGSNVRPFRLALECDADAGGFVAGIYRKNVQYCIDEKTEKIEAFAAKRVFKKAPDGRYRGTWNGSPTLRT